MSLLTDPDFLLQSLFSSYVALLPINSTPNLPQNSQSLHVQLARIKQPPPRASPPLESVLDLQNGRRGLNYTKTIVKDGSLGGFAGMRVGGRHRSWKGKGIMPEAEELIAPESSASDLRSALDVPPVIIHSPFDSPANNSTHIVPASPFSFSSSNDANSSMAQDEEYGSEEEDEVDSGDEESETTADLESIQEELPRELEEEGVSSDFVPRRMDRRVDMSSLEQFRITQRALLKEQADETTPVVEESHQSYQAQPVSMPSSSQIPSSILPIASTPSLVTSINNPSSFDSRITSIAGDFQPPPLHSPGSVLDFSRIDPQTRNDSLLSDKKAGPSALTQLLQAISSTPVSTNPFSRLYGSLSSLEITTTFISALSLYFPDSDDPNKSIEVKIRKDLSVEEIIGIGLFWFVELGLLPEMDLESDVDMESAKWNLRIVEDDGEVDDDFPALDRSRQISAFTFPAFAIVSATAAQIKDNEAKQSKLVRRASRILAGAPIVTPIVAENLPEQVGESLALQVLLKIMLVGEAAGESTTTILAITNTTYISDVLTQICKKKGIDNSKKEWSLIVQVPLEALQESQGGEEDFIILPEDRTVESLGEIRELELRKLGKRVDHPANLRLNNDPSASIFKRLSQPLMPEYQRSSTLMQLPSRNLNQSQSYTNSNYFTYSVQRKLSLPLSYKHSRNIVIDLSSLYLYFLPGQVNSIPILPEGIFDESDKVRSFHGSLIVEAKESRRKNGAFKICIKRSKGVKRFDFETDRKITLEIVKNVNMLMQMCR